MSHELRFCRVRRKTNISSECHLILAMALETVWKREWAGKVLRGYAKSEPGAVATGSKCMHNRFVFSNKARFS